MSAMKDSKISSFFAPVSAARNRANQQLDSVVWDEKLAKETEEKVAKAAILEVEQNDRRKEVRKRRIEEKPGAEKTEYDLLEEDIERIGYESTSGIEIPSLQVSLATSKSILPSKTL